VTLTYGYDPSGDVTSITDSLSGSGGAGQGIATYQYDSALRLTTVTQSLGGTTYGEITITYDSGGRTTKVYRSVDASGTDVITTYGYDAANDVTGISNFQATEGNNHLPSPFVTDGPTYNSAGEMTQYSQTYGGNNVSNTYTYDHAGQLTGSTGTVNDSYSYDLNGNPNASGYTTGAGNEMTASPGYTYTYDNVGNLTSATNTSTHVTRTYTYDYDNRLTNVTVGGTVMATYTYNALGQRIGIDDSGTQTWTVYNSKSADANPYADFNGSGGLTMRYLDGLAVDELFARTSSGGTLAWYLTDQLGSVTDVVSSSGTDLDHIVYDPYGNIVTETNASNGDRFKFAGMEYDSTTGIYYDHARYYDAAIGRFISQDPTGFASGDTDLYRYVDNQPTVATDPDGLQVPPQRQQLRPYSDPGGQRVGIDPVGGGGVAPAPGPGGGGVAPAPGRGGGGPRRRVGPLGPVRNTGSTGTYYGGNTGGYFPTPVMTPQPGLPGRRRSGPTIKNTWSLFNGQITPELEPE
jgi:RHS repeat-associated protein